MRLRNAAACLAALALAAPAGASADTSTSTITVAGSGTVFVTPDVGTLSFSVHRTGATASAALSATNRRVNAVVGSLRRLGIASDAIQTEDVNVVRQTVRVGPRHHGRTIRRYLATEDLTARLHPISLIGPAIDALARAGVDNLDGPEFGFIDPTAGQIAATHAAVLDARRRADDAAAAAGYRVTGVQSIDTTGGRVVGQGDAGAGGGNGAPAPTPTTVNPGQEEIDATVQVVYTIAPA
jgi:uncharacterized protein YggE